MSTDPVVEELHRQRAEEMKRFNFDFDAYYRHLKEQESLAVKLLPAAATSTRNPSVQRTRVARC